MVKIQYSLHGEYAALYERVLSEVNGAVGPILTQDQLAYRLMVDWLKHFRQEDNTEQRH